MGLTCTGFSITDLRLDLCLRETYDRLHRAPTHVAGTFASRSEGSCAKKKHKQKPTPRDLVLAQILSCARQLFPTTLCGASSIATSYVSKTKSAKNKIDQRQAKKLFPMPLGCHAGSNWQPGPRKTNKANWIKEDT